ncbi:MAG: hypothetical protein ACRDY4_12705 [Acidimicrobiia bacterium]
MRHLSARRWLTAPVAALTILTLGAFGGDGDTNDKIKNKADDGKALIDDEFVDDDNGWGGESSPELEVVVNEETDTLDYLVHQDMDRFIEYFPDVLTPRIDKLRDVELEADVSFTPPGVAGLECRVADPSGESGDFSSYMFVAYPDGHVSISKMPAEGNEPEPLATTDGEAPLFDDPGEGFLHVGAECIGGKGGKPVRLAMSIDGETVLTAKDADDPLPTGGVLLLGAKSSDAIEEIGFQPYAVVWDTFTLTAR